MTRSPRRDPSVIFNHIVLILLTAFALAPILILGFNSVKSKNEIGENPLGFPRQIQLENFSNAWQQGKFSTTMRNSLIFVLGTVVLVLVLGGLAAYSLARLKPPGADGFMLYTRHES